MPFLVLFHAQGHRSKDHKYNRSLYIRKIQASNFTLYANYFPDDQATTMNAKYLSHPHINPEWKVKRRLNFQLRSFYENTLFRKIRFNVYKI